MLRNIFVFSILTVGVVYAVQGPFYSLLLYLFLAYFRPDQWLYDNWVAALNLSFIVGIWTVLIAVLSKERFPVNTRIGLLALFVLHALLSTISSNDPETAWFWFGEFSKWVLITYVLIVVATDAARFRAILLVIALSLGFEAAKQGWVSLIRNPGGANINELPMLGDNNGIAVGMWMLVPVLTVLGSTASSRWERWIHRFVAVGVVNRAITTYSRGGFLAGIALVIVYALRSTKRIQALAGILLAAAIVLPALPHAFWERMKTINTPESIRESSAKGRDPHHRADDESSLSRLHFWAVAVKMANDQPIFGVGFNAFNENYDHYDDTKGEYGEARSVHSTWFGVLAELGYPGLVLFLAQLGLAFGACRRARRAANLGSQYAHLRQFAFALETGLVAFVVGGSFLPYQYTEMVWHWFGLTIALDGLARAALASEAVAVASSPSPGPTLIGYAPAAAPWGSRILPAAASRRATS